MRHVNLPEHIEYLIETYLADGLSHEERISFESHCAGCQACVEALEQAREFEEKVFQSLDPDKSPVNLEDSLVKTFRGKVSKPKSRRIFRPFGYLFHARLLRWAAIPLAALILVVIGNMVMTPEMQVNNVGPKKSALAAKEMQAEYNRQLKELQAKVERAQKTVDKTKADTNYNLGIAYTRARMFEDAVQAYQNALAIDPKDRDIYYNMGVVYDEHLNNPEQAAICYDKYLELAPSDDSHSSKVQTWRENCQRRLVCEADRESATGGNDITSAVVTRTRHKGKDITDPTPAFSAVYEDTDCSDTALKHYVQYGRTTFGATQGGSSISFGDSTDDEKDIVYAGDGLTSDSTYYWRIQNDGNTSDTIGGGGGGGSSRVARGGRVPEGEKRYVSADALDKGLKPTEYYLTMQNDGNTTETIVIENDDAGTNDWVVKYYEDGSDLTRAVLGEEAGGYVVDNMIQRSDDGTRGWGGETSGVELGRKFSAGTGIVSAGSFDFFSFGVEETKKGEGELGKLVWEEPARKTSVLGLDPIIVSLSEPSDVREGFTDIRESTERIEGNTEVLIPEQRNVFVPVEPAVRNPVARMPILLATNALNPQQKIIKSGTLTFEVESFDKAYQQVVKIITEAKGYVASSSATKLPNGKVRGQIVIRVLPELFDAVTLRLRVLGELKNQNVTAEDITKKYFDLQARLKNARAMEERLIKLATEKTGDVEDLLKVEKELGNTREKIERFQGELKYYDNLVSLATIKLEINEKDIEKPFEYVQTQSANLSLAVANVVTAYHQAQAMVHALDGQIVEARVTDQNNRIAGIVKAYVDAEYFTGLMEDMKGLGEVKSAVAEQRRTSSSGKASADKSTKIRKERGLINLTLNPPAGEYIQTKQALIILKSSDVNKAYAQAQDMAAQVKAKILRGKLNRETDQIKGQLFCQVKAESFRSLINSLRTIAEVKSCSVEEDQIARGIDPKSMLQASIRKEPGQIRLVIVSPAPIVPKAGGISATLKKTLKGSFGGLLWSLERLVVGLATIGPWLLILILVIILARRYFRRSSKKNEVK